MAKPATPSAGIAADSAGAPPTAMTVKRVDSRNVSYQLGTMLARREPAPGTVLTIRVKKADADAFAKGDLKFEEFQKKASVRAYAGYGHGLTSLNSWIQEPGSSSKLIRR